MLSPGEFVCNYTTIGMGKSRAPWTKLLLLSVLAGFYIGMGAMTATTASFGLPSLSVARLVCGMLFPFGLILVIFTGAELFTGNCMITISVLEGGCTWREMLRNLILVYLGNLIGAVALAAAWVYSGQPELASGALGAAAVKTAAAKCALPFGQAVILGVLCNILVCAGVMCALCAKSAAGRAVGAFVPVAFFVICGFEHCVANMYYIPAGLLALGNNPELADGLNVSALTWGNFLAHNLLPVTLGNLLGGYGFGWLIWCSNRKIKFRQETTV